MSKNVKVRTFLILLIYGIIISSFLIKIFFSNSLTFQMLLSVAIVLILGIIFYYYLYQLKEVHYIKNDKIVLKSRLGKESISIKDIIKIRKVKSSSVPITTGSLGLFGVMCTTMDGYKANYSDTTNTYTIETKEVKYLISSLNSQKLIQSIESEINTNL